MSFPKVKRWSTWSSVGKGRQARYGSDADGSTVLTLFAEKSGASWVWEVYPEYTPEDTKTGYAPTKERAKVEAERVAGLKPKKQTKAAKKTKRASTPKAPKRKARTRGWFFGLWP